MQPGKKAYKNEGLEAVMEKSEIYAFMREQTHAVLSTVSPGAHPEAALVEIAVTPELEIFFDTIDITRKCANLRQNPHIAFVLGSRGPQTLQYEGIADEPGGADLEQVKAFYFSCCPSGANREGWPGLTYFRVRPRWVRLSNYFRPRSIQEMEFPGTEEAKTPIKRSGFLSSLFNRD